jgi:hypothetical protein
LLKLTRIALNLLTGKSLSLLLRLKLRLNGDSTLCYHL